MKKFLLFLILFPLILFSAPPIPGKKGWQGPKDLTLGLKQQPLVKTTGTISIIFLKVEFSDGIFTHNDSYFESLANRMKEYYLKVSNGQLILVSTITSTFALTQTIGYYGNGNPENFGGLKDDAIATATLSGINFSSSEHIMILHAGAGEESDIYGQHPEQIWSCNIGTISIIPEMENYGISPFGIWCHEFGHNLGLVDLYKVGTVGYWSLMDSGGWNGNGKYPANLDPYSKIRLNWITPIIATTTLTLNLNDLSIYQLGTLGVECFLVEKRYEPFLGEGFLIWHYQGVLNNLTGLALLQADGRNDLENGRNYGDWGDPFPGETKNLNPSLPPPFNITILVPSLTKGKAFPNPINLSKTRRIYFETNPGNVVNIYNIAGEHIKELSNTKNIFGMVHWDIDNIASGVYIFIVKDKNGNKSYGKLGVIK